MDYVLWGDDGKPLGLIEAKRTAIDPEQGREQARLYADALEREHGQRPVIFYTNGPRSAEPRVPASCTLEQRSRSRY